MHAIYTAAACLLLAQLAIAQDQPIELIPVQPLPLQAIPLGADPLPIRQPTPALPLDEPVPRQVAPPAAIDTTEPSTQSEGSLNLPKDPNGTSSIVVPASADVPFSGPPGELAERSATGTPKQILARLDQTKPQWLANSTPLTLREAIDRASSRTQRTGAIQAYWKLTVALADYLYATDEARELEQLAVPELPLERARLQAAIAASLARQSEAKVSVVAAQHDLADLISMSTSEQLPLSTDRPLVDTYRTEFDALFAARPVPVRLRKIDRTLPLLLELIRARSASVSTAGLAFTEQAEAYDRQSSTVNAVLEAHAELRSERVAFLATVRDYNVMIADYALSVASSTAASDEIVNMLIERRPATESVLVKPNNPVQPASVNVPVNDTPPLKVAPPTELVPVDPPSDEFVPRKRRESSEPAPPPPVAPSDD